MECAEIETIGTKKSDLFKITFMFSIVFVFFPSSPSSDCFGETELILKRPSKYIQNSEYFETKTLEFSVFRLKRLEGKKSKNREQVCIICS